MMDQCALQKCVAEVISNDTLMGNSISISFSCLVITSVPMRGSVCSGLPECRAANVAEGGRQVVAKK